MKTLLLFIFIPVFSFAQGNKAEEILDKVKENFNIVKTYEVDVHIKVDVNLLKVPESNAKIYYKQPDKVRMKSKGFAMLPKEGLNFSPLNFLNSEHTSILDKEVNIDGYSCYLIKIIPLGDKSDLILTNFWIDKNKYTVRQIESTTKSNGTFTINLKYDNEFNYPLPSSMIFAFNIRKMELPEGITGEMDDTNQSGKIKQNKKGITTGKVYITYSNYKVNINLSDSIFNDIKK